MYLAPAGLWLTLDSGQFEAVELNTKTGAIRVRLVAATPYLHAARLRIEQPAKIAGMKSYRPSKSLKQELGAYEVPLVTATAWMNLIRNL